MHWCFHSCCNFKMLSLSIGYVSRCPSKLKGHRLLLFGPEEIGEMLPRFSWSLKIMKEDPKELSLDLHFDACRFIWSNWTQIDMNWWIDTFFVILQAWGKGFSLAPVRPINLSSQSSLSWCRQARRVSCIAWSSRPCWDIPTLFARPLQRRCHGSKGRQWRLQMCSLQNPEVMQHPESFRDVDRA